jgi:hypothetical protein
MNFVTVNSQLRNVAQLVRRCPLQTLRNAYAQAVRDWCHQTHWLRKDITTSTIFQSGAEAAFVVPLSGQDDEFLEVIGIRDHITGIDTTTSPRPSEFKIWPGDPSNWDLSALPSVPRWYAYRPEGMFDLYPSPRKDYGLRITAVLQPKDNALSVPDVVLKKWSSDIEAGALEYLFGIPGEAWSNKASADEWGKTYRSGINNAKADAQRRFNTGAQRVRPVRFIRGLR